MREHERPSIDPEAARIEPCRRLVHAFGPITPAVFAWWADVLVRDARKSSDLIADELVPVDLAGHDAWLLAADESTVRSAEPMRGVRLLAAPDLRLFGRTAPSSLSAGARTAANARSTGLRSCLKRCIAREVFPAC